MIAKKHRISKGFFKNQPLSSRPFHGSYCTLRVYSGVETWKVAVVVSKKVAAKAVDRNLLKRRVYETVRIALHHTKPVSVVIFPKKEMLAVPFAAARADVVSLLKIAKIV